MATPAAYMLIDRLNDDILCLIFLALQELATSKHRPWAPSVTISHVCRRWRQQALGCAALWTTISWSPGQPLAAALAALERSRMAEVHIILHMSRIQDWLQNARDTVDAHTLSRVIVRSHLHRVSTLDIVFSTALWNVDVFALLCADAPAEMPALRVLRLDSINRFTPPSEVHIAARNLERLEIPSFSIRAWNTLLGPSTVLVKLGGFEIKLSDLVQLLRIAPNLASLAIGFNSPTLINNDLPNGTSFSCDHTGVRDLRVEDVPTSGIELLCRLLPCAQIPNIHLSHCWDDHPPDIWADFLAIRALGDIEELTLLGSLDSEYTLELIAAQTTKKRSVLCPQLLPHDILERVFDAQPCIFGTLHKLSLDLQQWGALVQLLHERNAWRLSSLRTLTISIVQDMLEGDEGDIQYVDSSALDLPILEALHLAAEGSEPPTVDLVRHLLLAIAPMFRYLLLGARLLYEGVGFKDELLHRCDELFADADEDQLVRDVAAAVEKLLRLPEGTEIRT
ncbi:hypothetical protein EXIGLDRAFT_838164 [Exidia glandulosa HHB12029]|uniref:F-box domain-containing protein n=1 Tax=Exidia glandulosa HHB12029 TaxID=1314781 RepID=A0A165G357_EXIGL|nr:hypothetical protein EXIGLDRAFT_838164 [Exidia glandulosa HHB12029]